jgi:anaerobic ribonucleoside-triphosphate reductase
MNVDKAFHPFGLPHPIINTKENKAWSRNNNTTAIYSKMLEIGIVLYYLNMKSQRNIVYIFRCGAATQRGS